MKYIAKCKTGKEYMHTLGYYTRNDNVAQTVADALNDAKHELKNGEHWHVYDGQNSLFCSRHPMKRKCFPGFFVP